MHDELKFEVIDAPASDRKLPVVQGFRRGELITQGPGAQFEALRAIFATQKKLSTRMSPAAELSRLLGEFFTSPDAEAFTQFSIPGGPTILQDPFLRGRQTGKSQMIHEMMRKTLATVLFFLDMERAHPRRMRGLYLHSHKGRPRRQHKLRVSPLDQKDLSHDVFTRGAVVRYRDRYRA